MLHQKLRAESGFLIPEPFFAINPLIHGLGFEEFTDHVLAEVAYIQLACDHVGDQAGSVFADELDFAFWQFQWRGG